MTAAFNASLLSERSHLSQFAMYLAKGRDAEDLVQDTLLKALENEGRFDGANLRGWLFTILRNTFFSRGRKHGRTLSVADWLLTQHTSDAIDAVAAFEARDALKHLDELPAGTRELLILAVDTTIEDLAAKYGVPTGTIKSRLNRARAALHRVVDA